MRALAVVPLLLSAIVFHGIVRNFFFTDDFLHLYQVAEDPLRFLVEPYGGHVYLTRNAIFWVCAALFDGRPAPYFWLALATHLLNVWLLFRFLRVLFGSDRLACFGAALWGACPVHEGVLGWYAVYGQAVATMLLLAVLGDVARPGEVAARRALLWCAALLVATTCFGVGLGAAIVFPALVAILRPAAYARRATRRVLLAMPLATVALYVGLHAFYAFVYGNPATDSTQYLNLLHGITPIAYFLPLLLGGGLAQLLLGPAFVPDVYPDATALIAIGAVVASMLAAAVFGDAHVRRSVVACVLLAFAIYGTIAAGRGLFLLLGRPPAVLGATPRYHYASGVALTGAICAALAWLGERLAVPPRWASALLALWLVTTLAVGARAGFPIDHHDEARQQTESFLAGLHAQAKAAPPGALVTIENRYFRPIGPMIPPSLFPGSVAAFMIFSPSDELDGHPVRFATGDQRCLGAIRPGGRLARLLVGPDVSSGTPDEDRDGPAVPSTAPDEHHDQR